MKLKWCVFEYLSSLVFEIDLIDFLQLRDQELEGEKIKVKFPLVDDKL